MRGRIEIRTKIRLQKFVQIQTKIFISYEKYRLNEFIPYFFGL